MKTEIALEFWKTKVDLADHIGEDASQMSRYVRYGELDKQYDAKIKKGIKARVKLLTKKAEELEV